MKYTRNILKKIEDLFKAFEYVIRYERGNFQSGYCIVENKKVVVINKFYDVEARCGTLLEILGVIGVNTESLDEEMLEFYQKVKKKVTISQKENETESA